VRTRDWLLELAPDAREALVLAALTHDIERHFPGGPVQDFASGRWDDPAYNDAHAERSAEIVAAWLREQGAAGALIRDVRALVRRHEFGGDPDADLLQAADSLSFLETLADVAAGWVRTGQASADQAKAKLRWMLERIRVERARGPARPLYEGAVSAVDAVAR
jgi:hypothetical protein